MKNQLTVQAMAQLDALVSAVFHRKNSHLITPSNNTKSIDHCCVRICTNHAIRIESVITVKYDTPKVLKVNLKKKKIRTLTEYN